VDQFLSILSKPDNIPVALMVPLCIVLIALWWRAARTSDRILEEEGPEALRAHMEGARPEPVPGEEPDPDPGRVHTWPYLVRVELIATLVVILILVVWSIAIDAPLEQHADPTRTPNPSKAPWYFLGLQEMLVYFDPWIAGVMLPSLIIGGLCAIPYIDVNPEGSGHYGWKDRKFAITTFLFGFVILWLLLIIVGVFFRGPGWNWFWPWETWDPERAVATPNRNWSDLFGLGSGTGAMIFGALTIAVYYGLAVLYWLRKRGTSPTLQRLGKIRYAITAFLFLTMMALPIKMLLRHLLGVKYVLVTPWLNI
jgi:hypothetical protein